MIKYDEYGRRIVTACHKCGCTKAVQNYLCPECGEVVMEVIVEYEGYEVAQQKVKDNLICTHIYDKEKGYKEFNVESKNGMIYLNKAK